MNQWLASGSRNAHAKVLGLENEKRSLKNIEISQLL